MDKEDKKVILATLITIKENLNIEIEKIETLIYKIKEEQNEL